MKTIKIKNVQIAEIEVLQEIVSKYIQLVNLSLHTSTNKIGPGIVAIDLSTAIYYNFRKKIESTATKITLKLRPSEAVILLEMTLNKKLQLSEYEIFLMEKFKNILHSELTNI